MTIRSTMAVMAALCVSTSARAQAEPLRSGMLPGDRYVGVRLGAAVPQHDDLEGFDTGLAADVALGMRFAPNVAGELGVGYAGSSTGTQSLFVSGTQVNAKASAYFIPITASLKLIAPLGPIDLYGLGGLGVYFGHMELKAASAIASASTSDSSTSLGLHVGAGTLVRIAPRAALTADVRYHVAKAEFFDLEGNVDHLQVLAGVAFGL